MMNKLNLPPLPYSSREFDPTSEDLISHYLKNHILKQSYPESGIIQEETIFGENINPWDKFCNPYNPYPWEETSTSTPTLFLFTKLSDVGYTEKSSSVQKYRKTGCGTWHGTSSMIEVKSSADEDVVIGYYKILSFRSTNGEETKGHWIMTEYSISDKAFPEVRKVEGWQNQVVCRIKRDDTKSNVGGKVTKKEDKKKPLPKKRKSSPEQNNPAAEVEEKPAVMDDNAGFVNHDDRMYYGELTNQVHMACKTNDN